MVSAPVFGYAVIMTLAQSVASFCLSFVCITGHHRRIAQRKIMLFASIKSLQLLVGHNLYSLALAPGVCRKVSNTFRRVKRYQGARERFHDGLDSWVVLHFNPWVGTFPSRPIQCKIHTLIREGSCTAHERRCT